MDELPDSGVNKKEEQRGKRRSALLTELIVATTLALAIYGYGNAFEIFPTVVAAGLGYSAALRGIDAHYNPKRL